MRLKRGVTTYKLPRYVDAVHSVILKGDGMLSAMEWRDLLAAPPSGYRMPRFFSFVPSTRELLIHPAPRKNFYIEVVITKRGKL